MHVVLNKVLFWFAATLIAIDAAWLSFGHFRIDAGNYAFLLLLVPPLMAGAHYYGARRNEPAISATLAGAAFLVATSAACPLLSYLLLTVAGPRIDALLAGLDRSIGFYWPAVMSFAANHNFITWILGIAYDSVIPQTVALLLVLGWKKRVADSYGFSLAIAIAAVVTIAVWACFPSFGAFSVYNLPPDVASKLGLLALDGNYGKALVQLLAHGPGLISPKDVKGIVGFPSYHTVQALVLAWYVRKVEVIRWPVIALNALVLVSTPIHGGHHLFDMFGGAAVTVVAIFLSSRIVRWAEKTAPLPAAAQEPLSAQVPTAA